MKYGLIVTCQVMKNKAWYEGGFAWAPAGGFVFHVEVDINDWMYNSDAVREAIERVIAIKSNHCESFEVVSMDYQFSEPEDITKEFKAAYEVAEPQSTDGGQDYI